VPPGDVDRIVTLPTSGTTGEPKRLHFTTADQELTLDFFRHGMSVLVRPGQRVLILLPGQRPGSVGDLLRAGLRRMDVEGVVHGPVADPEGALEVLADDGEVVFTTLTREAMPLVRYRTSDRGRFVTEPCPCGTQLRRLERVRARLAGRARLRGGETIDLAALDEALFALPPVLDVRARLAGAGRQDVLDIEVLAPDGGVELLRTAGTAVAAVPALTRAVSAGQLHIDMAVASEPWPQGVGTAKRTLVQS
jgi:phenylacetate-coenzyme A ligase PaaK-like adenylate-forming protein